MCFVYCWRYFQAQLWTLNQTYEESMRLLGETNAAVEMHNHGGCAMDFSGIDIGLVSDFLLNVFSSK